MKKTFEEIIETAYSKSRIFGKLQDDEILELLEFIREKTLIEAANQAEADYTLVGLGNDLNIENNIEVYVLKQSILGLDKNSIEI